LQANFPTTKESLEGVSFRRFLAVAELIITSTSTDRERAAQKAAANAAEASKAEAEHQKAIIQELDSFRGSHLDPNAHHWDEVRPRHAFFRPISQTDPTAVTARVGRRRLLE
jgi:hypothetical protein